MRFHSLALQSLVGVITLAGTVWVMPPAHAQPNPIVQNRGKKVWSFRSDQRPPGDGFEAIVVRISPGNPDQFPARIWLYEAVADASSSTGYVLKTTENYSLDLQFLNRQRSNKRSNLFATPQQSTNSASRRYFAITGTQTPGGPATTPPDKRMLRLLTFLVQTGSGGGGGGGEDAESKPSKKGENEPKRVINCEDYPDDEMLEEDTSIVYDETDPDYDPLDGQSY